MAKRYYSVARLSDRISQTPEGFLICLGVPITRTGELMYASSETPVTPGKDGHTVITRSVEDIHDPETIASFEGKPVTIQHPEDFVTPQNWKELTVGIVQNVRPGEGEDADKLLADLLLTDHEAIHAVVTKRLREVSCGYEAEYVEESPGRGRQENIIGNHVALVDSGRCGSECAIFDHAPQPQRKSPMTVKEKIMGLFGKALDEAMPDETPQPQTKDEEQDVPTLLKAILARLDALEGKSGDEGEEKPEAKDEEEEKAKDEEEVKPAADEGEENQPAEEKKAEDEDEPEGLDKRLAAIEAALEKLIGMEQAEAAADANESEDADEEEYKDEDTSEASQANDAETVARAEILAPGIRKTGDVKTRALNQAYATDDGRALISKILAGKPYKSADTNTLFMAASEMLKTQRRSLMAPRVSLDSLPSMKPTEMTPEKLNALNAARYGRKP